MRKISDKHERRYRIDQFNYHSRRYNWPYCLQRQNNGKWVILNRNYKPLNMYTAKLQRSEDVIDLCVDCVSPKWVDYGPFEVELPKLTPAIIQQLSWKFYKGEGSIHLYNDGCVPESKSSYRQAYVEKLKLLADVLRKEGDERQWKEIFNGQPEISWHQCKPYERPTLKSDTEPTTP